MELKAMVIIIVMSIISGGIEAGPHSYRLQVFALTGSMSALITFASFAVWMGHPVAVFPYFLAFCAANLIAFVLCRTRIVRMESREDER